MLEGGLLDGWVALVGGALLGAAVALTFAFFRWRYRRKLVPRGEWQALVSGYVDLENLVEDVNRERTDSLAEMAAMGERLEQAIGENGQLRARLHDLEVHLEKVTGEATTLVNGLRANEKRWEQAEAKHRRTEQELESRKAAHQDEVTRRLALQETLMAERAEADTLRAVHQELAAQLQEIKATPPTVDLREREPSPRRWRRATRLFSHSHGQLPD
ncbi:MAG: hypothetical protein ACN4GZ_03790 [Acidimicrobiales bacterium]